MNGLLFCIVMSLIVALVFGKKKPQQQPPRKSPPTMTQPRSQTMRHVASEQRDENAYLRENPQNVPKNSEFFTYETLDKEGHPLFSETKSSQNSTVEKTQQYADNEQVKNIDLQFDMNEIQKGFIYSIILKRPDF